MGERVDASLECRAAVLPQRQFAARAMKSASRPSLPWGTLSILTGLNILSYMDRQLLAFLSLPIQKSLQISDVQLGLLQGFAFSLIFTLSSLPVGWLVDHWRRSWLVFFGVVVWSIATMGCGLARNYTQILVCRMAVGVGEATLAPSAYAILAEETPRGRLGLSMGIYAIGASIGISLALAGGGILVDALAGYEIVLPIAGRLEAWQSAFLLLGFPGTLLALLALRLPRRAVATSSMSKFGRPDEGFLRLIGKRPAAFLSQLVGFAMLGLSGYAITGWAPAHFGRNFGWPLGLIGPVLGIAIGLCGLAGTLLAGHIADRRFRTGNLSAYYDTQIVATCIGAPLTIGAFVVGNPWLAAILLGIGFMSLCSFGGSSTASLQLMTPAQLRGRAGSCYLFTVNILGLGFGPLAVGALTQYVFGSPAMVGRSVAVMVAIASMISILCMTLGRAGHVAAIRAASENA